MAAKPCKIERISYDVINHKRIAPYVKLSKA